jgi:hypothetical protein
MVSKSTIQSSSHTFCPSRLSHHSSHHIKRAGTTGSSPISAVRSVPRRRSRGLQADKTLAQTATSPVQITHADAHTTDTHRRADRERVEGGGPNSQWRRCRSGSSCWRRGARRGRRARRAAPRRPTRGPPALGTACGAGSGAPGPPPAPGVAAAFAASCAAAAGPGQRR